MQAHPEHEKDHADFGKLIGEAGIRDKTRSERADNNACKQIAGDRRNLQAVGKRAHQKGDDKTRHNRGDKWGIMHQIFQFAYRLDRQAVYSSPDEVNSAYWAEPITMTASATAPAIPPNKAGTNHHGGGFCSSSMTLSTMSERRRAGERR